MGAEDCLAIIATLFAACLNCERILKLKLYTLHVQNYCISGLCPVVRNYNYKEAQRFRNWTCLLPQVRGGRETSTLLGSLEKPNLNHWTDPETDPVSETLCFFVFRISDDGLSPETQ
jgi:hypothetical protein